MNDVTIRMAVKSDASILKEIARDVVTHNYTRFLGVDNVSIFIDSGQSDQEIDDGIEHAFVMECQAKIVGFAIINEVTLHLIMIAPECQHQGYGSKLLTYIEQKIFEDQHVIELQSFADNLPTNQFYLKHGWTVEGTETIEGLNIKTLQMKKHS